MRLRYSLFLIFISICLPCVNHNAAAQNMSQGDLILLSPRFKIQLSVRDSVTNAPLPGAVVTLFHKKDSVYCETDRNGLALFFNHYAQHDSLKIDVNLLGFKKYQGKIYSSDNGFKPVDILLQEKPLELNSLIITDKAVAMVIKGDTTVFNSSAYHTMAGSSLKSLLEKLPGIEMHGGNVYASGKIVRKILIDDTMLFGNNIHDALELVDADNVSQVKVFDEHKRDRLIDADTLKQKERVINIVTKNKLKNVTRFQIMAQAGAEAASKAYRRPRTTGVEKLEFNKYAVGQPNFSANLLRAKNDSEKPDEYVTASVDFGHIGKADKKGNISNINNNTNIYYKSADTDNLSMIEYRDALGGYTEKSDDKKSGDLSLSEKFSYSKSFKGKSAIELSANIDYTSSNLNDLQFSKSNRGGIDFNTDIHRRDRQHNINPNINLTYTYNINDKLFLYSSLYYSAGFNFGHGSIIDDNPLSSLHQNIRDTTKNYNNNAGLVLDGRYSLTSKFSINLRYSLDYSSLNNRNTFFDKISGTMDMIKSLSYNFSELGNSGTLGFSYHHKAMQIALDNSFSAIKRNRTDQIPAINYAPVKYLYYKPQLTFSGNWPKLTLFFQYTLRPELPQIEQTGKKLNDTNPFFLIENNPDLKMSFNNEIQLSVSYMLPKINTYINGNCNLKYMSNAVVNKIHTFSTDTFLDKYGVTAKAGSQLQTPVNAGKTLNYMASLSSRTTISAIKTTVSPMISYSDMRTPFYIEDTMFSNQTKVLTTGINLMNFASDKVQTTLNLKVNSMKSYSGTKKIDSSIQIDAGISTQMLFFGHLRFQPSFNFTSMDSRYDELDFKRYTLNAELIYVLGKKSQCETGIFGKNLLDDVHNSSSHLADQAFYKTVSNSMLGRIIGIKFLYKFK